MTPFVRPPGTSAKLDGCVLMASETGTKLTWTESQRQSQGGRQEGEGVLRGNRKSEAGSDQ